jgi:hypothetical protein
MRSLLLVESFDVCPSNQYILVRLIPSCFRFAKMCLCQVSLLSSVVQYNWHHLRGVAHCSYRPGGGGHVSLRVVNITWIDLDSLAFILHFLNQF